MMTEANLGGLFGGGSQGDGRKPDVGELGIYYGRLLRFRWGEEVQKGVAFGRADANAMRKDVCDKVGSEESGAKDAVASLIKRLAHRNANVQLYTLEVRYKAAGSEQGNVM